MGQRGRPGLSPDQKRELWRRWKAGESLSEIGRALGRQAGPLLPVHLHQVMIPVVQGIRQVGGGAAGFAAANFLRFQYHDRFTFLG